MLKPFIKLYIISIYNVIVKLIPLLQLELNLNIFMILVNSYI